MTEDGGLLEEIEPPKYRGGNETSNCNSTILYSLDPLVLLSRQCVCYACITTKHAKCLHVLNKLVFIEYRQPEKSHQ